MPHQRRRRHLIAPCQVRWGNEKKQQQGIPPAEGSRTWIRLGVQFQVLAGVSTMTKKMSEMEGLSFAERARISAICLPLWHFLLRHDSFFPLGQQVPIGTKED